jgi:hypothetical protein
LEDISKFGYRTRNNLLQAIDEVSEIEIPPNSNVADLSIPKPKSWNELQRIIEYDAGNNNLDTGNEVYDQSNSKDTILLLRDMICSRFVSTKLRFNSS